MFSSLTKDTTSLRASDYGTRNVFDRSQLIDSLPKNDMTCLYQSDFDDGTKIIDRPGKWKLCEDIVFYPKVNAPTGELPQDAFEPIFPSPIYDENKFGLGFFSALAIAASNVELDLNGYTIEQSQEHALLQRFFSVIELADSPFIDSAGPADFIGDNPLSAFRAASDVTITGPGTIGLSSHHGIHGNENKNVVIKDIVFEDFEVAAVSLNNVDNLLIENCDLSRGNRQDVPVLGMFSAAKFILPYARALETLDYSMKLRGVEVTAKELHANLTQSIENVFWDVITNGEIDRSTHPDEHKLFHNQFGRVDGPCYGILVHGKGPAVGDFGMNLESDADAISSNVVIRNNVIKNIKCWTNEVPAAVEESTVMNDARGSILQFVRSPDKDPIAIDGAGRYKGNVVADMQIMVAKAIRDGTLQSTPAVQTATNTIDDTIIQWAESGSLVYSPKYRCNGDSMHHVSKGMAVIRVEDTLGFEIVDNEISQIENLSPKPFDECTDFHGGANYQKSKEREAANIRGIVVSAAKGDGSSVLSKLQMFMLDTMPIVSSQIQGSIFCSEVCGKIHGNKIEDFSSINADSIVGIELRGVYDYISIRKNDIDLNSEIGKTESDEYVAVRLTRYDGDDDESFVEVGCDNGFQQEVEERIVKVEQTHTRCPMSGNEWPSGKTPGSCPFANNLFV